MQLQLYVSGKRHHASLSPQTQQTKECVSVLRLFIMSTLLGALIFLSPVPKQTPPNCYQVCVCLSREMLIKAPPELMRPLTNSCMDV